jgi:N-acylneuraminate cytidylyltransferase
MKNKVLAIIPARSGSKTIPNKNVKLFNGHPLIAYSIEAGLKSIYVDKVVVSTDSREIADVALRYGAEVPVLRPLELAQDDITDFPVVKHIVYWLDQNENYKADIIVFLRPTSPFRPVNLVDDAIEILKKDKQADSIRAVVPTGETPYKMWNLDEKKYLSPLLKSKLNEHYNLPRQKLPDTYWQTGHLDVLRADTIKEKCSITGDNILPYHLDVIFSVDIDNDLDWELAEWRVKFLRDRIVIPNDKISFSRIELIVSDFDGVFTDNKVVVSEDGKESVVCTREDGLGIDLIKKLNIPFYVLSSEKNPVVIERCNKLDIISQNGLDDKKSAFNELVSKLNVDMENVIYIGNDLNDLECIIMAGIGVAVADSAQVVLDAADLVLTSCGGNGAVRELIDLIITYQQKLLNGHQNV